MKTDSMVIDDLRFIRGEGSYIDDMRLPGMLYLSVLKSPYSHAKITRIDTSKAKRLTGVRAIATGLQAKEIAGPLPFALPKLEGKLARYCLASDRVRYVGEPVVAIAAEDRYTAVDAAESVNVEFDLLPCVTDLQDALKPSSPLIHENLGSNIAYHETFDFAEGIDSILEKCDGVVEGEYKTSRVTGQALDTFGVITSYDSRNNTLTFWSNFQYPNNFFGGMSIPKPLQMQNVDIKFMQNIDIGGSYGNKTNLLWLALSGMMAILTRRPVKFVETRSEHCLTGDCHAFDRFHRVKLGYMNDGRVRAIKLSVVEDIGAYPHIYTPGSILKPLAIINGQYNIPYAFYDVTCVFTNKAPVGAYRGLGAQSGVFPLERMMDRLARKLGIDPADVRRRNLLRGSDFPYRNPSGNIYDSGNYSELLEMVLDSCDYPELKKKCKEARHGSRKLGVGLATGVVPGSGGSLGAHQVESVLLKIGIQGKLFVGLPFPSSGQGHETIIKQLFSQTLGVSEDEIIVGRVNPTTLLPSVGPAADRLTSKLAAVSDLACEKVKQKTVRLAALLTRTDPADLVYDDGLVKSKTTPSQKIAFKQVMKMIEEQKEKMRPEIANELEFAVTYQQLNDVPDEKGRVHRYDTTSSAANVALVEVDSETGMVRLLKYWIAYDCGTVLNRRSVEGQVIGGLAQGIEEAMLSEFVYDDQGQLLNSSFVDYLVIGSVEMPDVVLSNIETPSPRNRLGVKGIGEGGILWSPPAVANAIEDALGSRDVTINEIPIRPKELLASRGF